MQIENSYPKLTKKNRQLIKLKEFWNFFLLAAARICITINLFVWHYPWSVIVCSWIWLFWDVLYKKPLDEDNIIKRISSLWIDTCFLIVLLDWFSSASFAPFVIPIIIFWIATILSIIFFVDYKNQKNNITSFYWILFLSLWAPLFMIIFGIKIRWPMIVAISVSGWFMLLWIVLFFKPLILELKKKFHV